MTPKRTVVAVAAGRAWKLYDEKRQDVYLFQAARSIQLVEYVASYSDKEVKPVLSKLLRHFPAVDWNQPNARRLQK